MSTATKNKTEPKAILASEFLKHYKLDPSLGLAERLTKFMLDYDEAAPGSFVSRSIRAKVAFNMRSAPPEDSKTVRERLPGVWETVKRKLRTEHDCGWRLNPYGAIALCRDGESIQGYHKPRERRKVARVLQRWGDDHRMIKRDEIRDPVLLAEFDKDATAHRTLMRGLSQLPSLLTTGEEKK
jgi:hypothetical protein